MLHVETVARNACSGTTATDPGLLPLVEGRVPVVMQTQDISAGMGFGLLDTSPESGDQRGVGAGICAGNVLRARAYSAEFSSLLDAATQEVLQIREILGPRAGVRALVLEPFSPALGYQLGAAGFAGELWALLRRPFPHPLAGQAYCGDHIIIADWPDAIGKDRQLASLAEMGRFDIVVMLELSRILPGEQISRALQWVADSLLQPYGYVVSGEPYGAVAEPDLPDLEATLLHSDLLLAADERRIEADWSWRLTRWQSRPGDSSRLTGKIVELSRADLTRCASRRQALVSCYQEVFGGDEWGEWVRCSDCHRHYSFREYESLGPLGRCVCGSDRPLDVYHTPDSVLGELFVDLRDHSKSRLYVRFGPVDEVEAFIWGSLLTAEQLASNLLSRDCPEEWDRLRSALVTLLHRQGIYDPSALILNVGYLGATMKARSLSLVRALITRMCQFAVESRVEAVVGATIPSMHVYTLLRGSGLETVYTYPARPRQSWTSRLDESGVVLGGSVRSLLSLASCAETRVALHIGRSTRRTAAVLRGGW